MTDKFGSLENVPLREAWPNEARDFTPWLSEYLHILSKDIGIDPPLETRETEVRVGRRYSADILAFDPRDGKGILIENQLEGSDHTHLGQILTYLAGLDAQTVIWIAESFGEEHLSAISWLNENTAGEFDFLAVKVIVGRFEGSEVGTIFDVIACPSNWWNPQRLAVSQESRAILREIHSTEQERRAAKNEIARRRAPARQSGGGLSPAGQFRSEFWTYYAERYPNDGVRKGFAGINPDYRVEDTGLKIRRFVAQWGVGLWIETSSADKDLYTLSELMQPFLPSLSRSLGISAGSVISSIDGLRNPVGCFYQRHIDTADRKNWPQAVEWLHNQLEIYRAALDD